VLLSAAPASGGSRSLTHQSTHTLAQAFVISRIGCCSSLLIELPLGTLARLGRVLRSAAVLLEDCPSFLLSLPICVMYYFGCLSIAAKVILWQRIQYRITAVCDGLPLSRCVLHCALSYLRDLCGQVTVLAARQVRGGLLVPRAHLATVQRRAFSFVCLSHSMISLLSCVPC